MTECTNLTMVDWTARLNQGFKPEIVFLTLPYERQDNLLKALPLCTAGTADLKIPKDFQQSQE
ncbi:hypothetical protein MSWAN_1007 [Methanobacterium paludis]|uniref:Uncharacterized protein n=1 Tax=Methanobacterium paludis (strain DSM 25820 / JCM 18151 / SWAN1) TaxID=868131 RepID=F6D390_METPW|nr:hypothetical protein MSWAN_1007 [Methanobacterium paludis]